MKKYAGTAALLSLFLLLQSCGPVGEKTASLTLVYMTTAVFSFLLLVGYLFAPQKREAWFVMLFLSVFVVNLGYLTLSFSKTIETALLSNTLAYFGSVFLPLSMLLIIMKKCYIKVPKSITVLLFAVTVLVFLLAASPLFGIKLYYEKVVWVELNGAGTLGKTYGPLHSLYLIYLLSYFAAIIYSIIYAMTKKKIDSPSYSVILLIAVFLNIGIWFIEQLVKIDFELLSVSYILTELFLLALDIMLLEAAKQKTPIDEPMQDDVIQCEPAYDDTDEKIDFFKTQLSLLTPTESKIYKLYIEGKGTREIMQLLNIKENTLKYHNKNIYSKLGVKSRKELIAMAAKIKAN